MRWLFVIFCIAIVSDAYAAHRRALLIGINDYTRSPWRDLTGAVTDVSLLRQMLILDGFHVVTLLDRNATRTAILKALNDLVHDASKDDVLLFYFAGHGTQRANSKSDEPDHMDEAIVPADSRRGADDIRDKELRPLFNAILDKGARLTIILDSCNSGSGARGDDLSRSVKPDLRDVADGKDYGPRPENRGALVLAAAQDFDQALETRAEGQFHGVFSWALIRAMRDSSRDESASDIFLRARARMRAETPLQEPVLAGTAAVRLAPFLGARPRDHHAVVAVERVDGNVARLQGGLANGLAVGTELRAGNTRLQITSTIGVGRSEARVESGSASAGMLLQASDVKHRWETLESPPTDQSPYRLAVRRRRDGAIATNTIFGEEPYDLLIRTTTSHVEPRFMYVFVIDSRGRSTLLFPLSGSVENRFPLSQPAANEIRLASFEPSPPYGLDTYFLLTTDEALPDPWILEFDDVHTRSARTFIAPPAWSLEKLVLKSIPPYGVRRPQSPLSMRQPQLPR